MGSPLTCAMYREFLSSHELVDELGNELFRILVRAVDVVAARDHYRDIERPDDTRRAKRHSK